MEDAMIYEEKIPVYRDEIEGFGDYENPVLERRCQL
jgi:hypothetical protein